jgi:hypothetical protein
MTPYSPGMVLLTAAPGFLFAKKFHFNKKLAQFISAFLEKTMLHLIQNSP